ncbi:SUN domain-containing ossification factor-like [Saccostrea echinata]|uniref:SUN domain-containing ossification factor-like n=1 Tax=Saccostrea echinata TaxID=191078 RepID=UPI002A811DC6|nr:SUN domain-containing ossification factor-like [Saccostrea echinata]
MKNMLKSDRLIQLVLLNLLLGFSSGDQTVESGGGPKVEDAKASGEEQAINLEYQTQNKETVKDVSGEQKLNGEESEKATNNKQGDPESGTEPPHKSEPEKDTQNQQEDKGKSTDKGEDSGTVTTDNTDLGIAGKESPNPGNVGTQENKIKENQDRSQEDTEKVKEPESDSRAETLDKEPQGIPAPPPDNEQNLPQQPAGTSTQTQGEPVSLTLQPVVKEAKDESAEKDFETFSEWRQKALAEEEKNKQKAEMSEQGVTTPKKKNGKKVNYASKDCGAKILASNPEAENVDRILTNNKDEYMINRCAVTKKWFVIELCEPIYINEIEAGSFELFSSRPENISVNVSDRYPTKEYQHLGVFTLTENRGLDKFQTKVENDFYVKYVKVEMLTHYGEEHYCPLTMFRVYGIPVELDDDDDLESHHEEGEHSGESTSDSVEGADSDQPKNLFSSAKDTVMKLVKKVLNVEEKTEISQLNNSLPLNATTNNTTDVNKAAAQEKMEPCEPKPEIPKEKSEADTVNKGETLPKPPSPTSCPAEQEKPCDTPGTLSDDMKPDLLDPAVSIVTKLEDHEQMPSEQLKPPMVSLIQSGDLKKRLTLYKMFLSCILPHRFKIRHRQNSTLSLCSYVRALKKDWISVPGEFTLPSRSRTHESSTVTPVVTVKQEVVDHTDVLSTPTSDVVETPTEKVLESQSPCFIPTPASTSDVQISTVIQVPSLDSEVPVQDSTVLPKETKTQQGLHQSPVLSTSLKTMDKTDIPEVRATASVSVENTVASEIPPAVSSTSHGEVISSQSVLEPSVVIDVSKDSFSETPHLQKTESLTTMPVSDTASYSTSPSSTEDSKTEQKMHLPEVNGASITTSSAVQTESSQDTMVNGQTSEEGDRQIEDNYPQTTVTPAPDTMEQTSESSYTLSADEIEYTPQKNLRLVKVPILPLQKRETAIMRLTNRIKALETNVSLSSRFLDEMTQKFKKQSEEMQKLLTAKFENVTKDLKEAERRDRQQQEQINFLEHRLDNLTDMVYKLQDEMSHLNKQVMDRQVFFTTIEVFVLFCILLVCLRRGKSSVANLPPEVRKLIEGMPLSMDVSKVPRRNSYSEGARKQNKLLMSDGQLQKHNSDPSLAQPVSVSRSTSSTSHGSVDQQRDFQRRKKKKRNRVQVSKSTEIHNLPEDLKNISADSHSEAGLLFTSDIPKELTSSSKPERNSGGLLSYFWKDKESVNNLAQKKTSCPNSFPESNKGQQSSKTVPLNGQKLIKKSSSTECTSSNKASQNGHVYVYPVIETLLPSMSCSKPVSGQFSGRPPDKNNAGHPKKKSHKRASSIDLSTVQRR